MKFDVVFLPVVVSGISAIVSFISIYLNLKSNRSIENIKHQNVKEIQTLQTEYNKDIERMRSEFALLSAKGSKQFEILQERRANKIEEIYIALRKYAIAFSKFASPLGFEGDPTYEEKIKYLNESYTCFTNIYNDNKIYLPVSLCSIIDCLIEETFEVGSMYISVKKLRGTHPSTISMQEERWEKLQTIWQERLPGLVSSIEKEFRSILGVE